MKQALGISINFEHVWSFEKSRLKRDFIESNWKPTFLFSDVTDIDDDGFAYEYVQGKRGKKVRVQKVDWIISGFSCRDASRLNQFHKERLSVVAENSHSTGSTIGGVLALVELASPSRVFLENVPGLKDRPPMHEGQDDDPPQSNFDCVAERLRGLGYSFSHSEFNAQSLGLPVARQRLFMQGRKGQHDEAMTTERMGEALDLIISGSHKYHLDDFLFDDYDGLYEDWKASPGKKHKRWDSIDDSWHELHKLWWAASPYSTDRKYYQAQLVGNPFYLGMTERVKDALLLHLCYYPFPGPERVEELAINLEASADRIYHRQASTQCLVPRGQIWLHHRQRVLLGVEALLLHGGGPHRLAYSPPRLLDKCSLARFGRQRLLRATIGELHLGLPLLVVTVCQAQLLIIDVHTPQKMIYDVRSLI